MAMAAKTLVMAGIWRQYIDDMSIIRNPPEAIIVPIATARDSRLSLAARGLLVEFLASEGSSIVRSKRMNALINELSDAGYVQCCDGQINIRESSSK